MENAREPENRMTLRSGQSYRTNDQDMIRRQRVYRGMVRKRRSMKYKSVQPIDPVTTRVDLIIGAVLPPFIARIVSFEDYLMDQHDHGSIDWSHRDNLCIPFVHFRRRYCPVVVDNILRQLDIHGRSTIQCYLGDIIAHPSATQAGRVFQRIHDNGSRLVDLCTMFRQFLHDRLEYTKDNLPYCSIPLGECGSYVRTRTPVVQRMIDIQDTQQTPTRFTVSMVALFKRITAVHHDGSEYPILEPLQYYPLI